MFEAAGASAVATEGVHATGDWLISVIDDQPGPDRIVELAAVDPLALDDRCAALLLEAWERQTRWMAAHANKILLRVAGEPRLTHDDFAREDVAVALGVAPSTAACRVDVARRLGSSLSATAAALAAGDITAHHATAMAEETATVEDAIAVAAEAAVLPRARYLTVPQLRRAVRAALAAADPAAFETAHADAAERRTVQRTPDHNGMATLTAWMPAPDVELVSVALDACAARKGPDDPRGMDARRADVLVGWALTALDNPDLPTTHRHRPRLQVTVDLPTLLGLADSPGHLAGYGPIPASVARRLAADAEWRRFVTDPVNGTLLDYGRTTYTPPVALADFVLARDSTCRFPRCSRPALKCDLDHGVAWDDGGATSAANLGPLCRRHHRLKTHAKWGFQRHADGAVTWTSRAGTVHALPPPSFPPDG